MITRNIDDIIKNIDTIIGDTPVAEQLDMAMRHHEHESYVTRAEYEALQKKVDKLLALVGDTPVSEQINAAIQNR